MLQTRDMLQRPAEERVSIATDKQREVLQQWADEGRVVFIATACWGTEVLQRAADEGCVATVTSYCNGWRTRDRYSIAIFTG